MLEPTPDNKVANQTLTKPHLIAPQKYRIRTPDDAFKLARHLANQCPDPESAMTGMTELLINAIEHGNLGIGYAQKGQLLKENRWEEEIEHRLALIKNQRKYAEVCFGGEERAIYFSVRDQGAGFNWRHYMKIDPDRITHLNGRGIAIAKRMSFDAMVYLGGGCEVHCKIAVT